MPSAIRNPPVRPRTHTGVDRRRDHGDRPLPGGLDDPLTDLSERQREALVAATELGYYEQPRKATHEDVARAMDCAPATASGHLQKAESKLVRAVVDEFGPRISE